MAAFSERRPDMKDGLGARIKRLRLARELTLKQVGAKAGVSPTHLSEIERGRTSPTVGALLRIATALGEEASRLIDEARPPAVALVRAGDRRELVENGVTVQCVTGPIAPRDLSMTELEVPPGGAVPRFACGGEEFMLVLGGAVDVTLAGGSVTLRAGDAVHCTSEDCGAIVNRGDVPARVIWVASPAAAL